MKPPQATGGPPLLALLVASSNHELVTARIRQARQHQASPCHA
jgi:hypothetical protein